MTLAAARAALAPRGVLRAAINLSNFLLVSDQTGATPRGISPSLCGALAQRLEVPLELVPYANPGLLADAATSDEWDVGLIGAEPARAATIAFTKPYAHLEATFLVRDGCPARRCDDVDAEGYSIAVSRRAAYALKLEASLASATLKQTAEPGLPASADLYFEESCDALAGLRPWLLGLLETDERFVGSRVLDGRFHVVEQAVGMPRGRGDAALPFLEAFVAEATGGGLVAKLIREHGVEGKVVVAS